jgi:hypothetical protein
MSHQHVKAVIDDDYFCGERKSDFLVALIIAEITKLETGSCFPSIETIAKRARTSVRGAQEALRRLTDDGKLSVAVGAHPSGTSVYRLLINVPLHPPQLSAHPLQDPPQPSAVPLLPEPEGTVQPKQPICQPTENEFVTHFLPSFVSYPDFPAEEYLRHRWSDFDSTGWIKGSRPILNWKALGGSLATQYRQDRNQKLLTGNPNGNNSTRTGPNNSRAADTLNHSTTYPKEGIIGGRRPAGA